MSKRVLFSWSGGKDSALALHELLKTGNFEVAALLTTVTGGYERVSMHGVRNSLLEKQAESMGIPLVKVTIPDDSTNGEYEARMREKLLEYKDNSIQYVAFGDIFLEDLRRHRVENLSTVGMMGIFPLWGRDTMKLAKNFITAGFKATVTCVDSNALDGRFVGKEFDMDFLSQLPDTVDPCGENGEFHSFVWDGPIFEHRIELCKGEVVLRKERFYYCDLNLPYLNKLPIL